MANRSQELYRWQDALKLKELRDSQVYCECQKLTHSSTLPDARLYDVTGFSVVCGSNPDIQDHVGRFDEILRPLRKEIDYFSSDSSTERSG
mmetsp:Transcript_4335/g.6357  ORF Transcript_4335/g.6357 Transcript_4335/m.6357 type:complete len:91 (+) Transcript_4335:403-675(+)